MSEHHRITRAEALAERAGAGGNILAYQLGARYPRFAGVSREALAEVFEAHGFKRSAESTRNIDAEKALSRAVSGRSKALCETKARAARNGTSGTNVKFDCSELVVDQDHVRAWGIARKLLLSGERGADYVQGARVYVSPAGIYAVGPVDGFADEACLAIANELAAYARWLLENADTTDASLALTQMYVDSGALEFIARGTYLAPVGRPDTDRVVRAIEDIYGRFYSETTRTGIRARAIAVTEHDSSAVCDSVIDDFEARAAELADFLKDEAGRSNVRASTLVGRLDTAKAFLADLGPARALVGEWAARFEKIGEAIRDAYAAAVDGQALNLPDGIDDAAVSQETPEPATAAELPSAPEAAPESEPVPPTEPAPVTKTDEELSAFDI